MYAYLRLLIVLLAILIPTCASFSPAFCLMYSARKLNKQVTVYSLDTLLSQIGKDDIKAVYCHPAYLTYMQSTSHKISGWMNHKQKLRFPGEISTTSVMLMIPL